MGKKITADSRIKTTTTSFEYAADTITSQIKDGRDVYIPEDGVLTDQEGGHFLNRFYELVGHGAEISGRDPDRMQVVHIVSPDRRPPTFNTVAVRFDDLSGILELTHKLGLHVYSGVPSGSGVTSEDAKRHVEPFGVSRLVEGVFEDPKKGVQITFVDKGSPLILTRPDNSVIIHVVDPN